MSNEKIDLISYINSMYVNTLKNNKECKEMLVYPSIVIWLTKIYKNVYKLIKQNTKIHF